MLERGLEPRNAGSPSELETARKWTMPESPHEEGSPANAMISVQSDLFQTSDLQNCQIVHFSCFKPLCLVQFVSATIGNQYHWQRVDPKKISLRKHLSLAVPVRGSLPKPHQKSGWAVSLRGGEPRQGSRGKARPQDFKSCFPEVYFGPTRLYTSLWKKVVGKDFMVKKIFFRKGNVNIFIWDSFRIKEHKAF